MGLLPMAPEEMLPNPRKDTWALMDYGNVVHVLDTVKPLIPHIENGRDADCGGLWRSKTLCGSEVNAYNSLLDRRPIRNIPMCKRCLRSCTKALHGLFVVRQEDMLNALGKLRITGIKSLDITLQFPDSPLWYIETRLLRDDKVHSQTCTPFDFITWEWRNKTCEDTLQTIARELAAIVWRDAYPTQGISFFRGELTERMFEEPPL